MEIGREDESKNNNFETGNGTARNYNEIWPFGRLLTSRFRWDMGG